MPLNLYTAMAYGYGVVLVSGTNTALPQSSESEVLVVERSYELLYLRVDSTGKTLWSMLPTTVTPVPV
jgi:hypothetical protein